MSEYIGLEHTNMPHNTKFSTVAINIIKTVLNGGLRYVHTIKNVLSIAFFSLRTLHLSLLKPRAVHVQCDYMCSVSLTNQCHAHLQP